MNGIAYRIEGLDSIDIGKIRSAACGQKADNEQGIITSMRIQSNLKDRNNVRIYRMKAGVGKAPLQELAQIIKLGKIFVSDRRGLFLFITLEQGTRCGAKF